MVTQGRDMNAIVSQDLQDSLALAPADLEITDILSIDPQGDKITSLLTLVLHDNWNHSSGTLTKLQPGACMDRHENLPRHVCPDFAKLGPTMKKPQKTRSTSLPMHLRSGELHCVICGITARSINPGRVMSRQMFHV